MNGRGRAVLAALVAMAALLQPVPTRAQDYDISVGWGGGLVRFQPFVEAGDAAPEDLGFGGTWVAILQAETWQLNRWVGGRLAGFYGLGSIDYPTAWREHSVYGIEAAALVRLLPPNPGHMMSVYLVGGGGITWFSMGDADVIVPGTSVEYDSGEARQLVALGGLGIEVLTGLRAFDGEIGVRAEALDNIHFDRPLRPVGTSGEMTHNLRFTLALFSGVPSLF